MSGAEQELRSASGLTIKRRRAILDAAAWTREALVVLAGHFADCVRASTGARDHARVPAAHSQVDPSGSAQYKEYKRAAEDACWRTAQGW